MLPLFNTLCDSSNKNNDLTFLFPGQNMVITIGKDLKRFAKNQKNTQVPQWRVNHLCRKDNEKYIKVFVGAVWALLTQEESLGYSVCVELSEQMKNKHQEGKKEGEGEADGDV